MADGANDTASGAGDWAEAFAWSQTRAGGYFSRVGPPPDGPLIELMWRLLAD